MEMINYDTLFLQSLSSDSAKVVPRLHHSHIPRFYGIYIKDDKRKTSSSGLYGSQRLRLPQEAHNPPTAQAVSGTRMFATVNMSLFVRLRVWCPPASLQAS